MNKKTENKLTRQKRIWEYSVAKRKASEREISRLEREVEKIQNSTPQAVRESSSEELARVEKARQPKEQRIIEDVRTYRKQRAKRRK